MFGSLAHAIAMEDPVRAIAIIVFLACWLSFALMRGDKRARNKRKRKY